MFKFTGQPTSRREKEVGGEIFPIQLLPTFPSHALLAGQILSRLNITMQLLDDGFYLGPMDPSVAIVGDAAYTSAHYAP